MLDVKHNRITEQTKMPSPEKTNGSHRDTIDRQPLIGSYAPEDCLFLLKPLRMGFETVENKEALIQSGAMHYSEIIHQEQPPSEAYVELFHQMMERYQHRLAREILSLAQTISAHRPQNIVLLSLARAGSPIGVLLNRALKKLLNRDSTHYAISIIRDRGIDTTALKYVLAQNHKDTDIVFIDGWTAKGVITRELHQAISAFNKQYKTQIAKDLYVVSDIGGTADHCATDDDYTIPSALLNATISGLVSRSILNDQISATDFHGCVLYNHLMPHDKSVWFVDQIFHAMQAIYREDNAPIPLPSDAAERQARANNFLRHVQTQYQVSDMNRVKPGIAEATRVLLRRVPDRLLLQQAHSPNTQHLAQLAKEKNVPIIETPNMPFGACALIKDVAFSKALNSAP